MEVNADEWELLSLDVLPHVFQGIRQELVVGREGHSSGCKRSDSSVCEIASEHNDFKLRNKL